MAPHYNQVHFNLPLSVANNWNTAVHTANHIGATVKKEATELTENASHSLKNALKQYATHDVFVTVAGVVGGMALATMAGVVLAPLLMSLGGVLAGDAANYAFDVCDGTSNSVWANFKQKNNLECDTFVEVLEIYAKQTLMGAATSKAIMFAGGALMMFPSLMFVSRFLGVESNSHIFNELYEEIATDVIGLISDTKIGGAFGDAINYAAQAIQAMEGHAHQTVNRFSATAKTVVDHGRKQVAQGVEFLQEHPEPIRYLVTGGAVLGGGMAISYMFPHHPELATVLTPLLGMAAKKIDPNFSRGQVIEELQNKKTDKGKIAVVKKYCEAIVAHLADINLATRGLTNLWGACGEVEFMDYHQLITEAGITVLDSTANPLGKARLIVSITDLVTLHQDDGKKVNVLNQAFEVLPAIIHNDLFPKLMDAIHEILDNPVSDDLYISEPTRTQLRQKCLSVFSDIITQSKPKCFDVYINNVQKSLRYLERDSRTTLLLTQIEQNRRGSFTLDFKDQAFREHYELTKVIYDSIPVIEKVRLAKDHPELLDFSNNPITALLYRGINEANGNIGMLVDDIEPSAIEGLTGVEQTHRAIEWMIRCNHNLKPVQEVLIGDYRFELSQPIKTDDGKRRCLIALVSKVGDSSPAKARFFYQSQSKGTWHVADHVTDGQYGKGTDYTHSTLLVEQLVGLLIANQDPIEKLPTLDDAVKAYFSTARSGSLLDENFREDLSTAFAKESHTIQINGELKPICKWQEGDPNPPSRKDLANIHLPDGFMPVFSNPDTIYASSHPERGGLVNLVYQQGQIEGHDVTWTMSIDSVGRVSQSLVPRSSRGVNSYGAIDTYIALGLLNPKIISYRSQLEQVSPFYKGDVGNEDRHAVYKTYYDVYPYFSALPSIQEFIRGVRIKDDWVIPDPAHTNPALTEAKILNNIVNLTHPSSKNSLYYLSGSGIAITQRDDRGYTLQVTYPGGYQLKVRNLIHQHKLVYAVKANGKFDEAGFHIGGQGGLYYLLQNFAKNVQLVSKGV